MASITARITCTATAALALALPATALAEDLPAGPPPAPPALPSLPQPPAPATVCAVPVLKGLTVPAASRKLGAAGCRLGRVSRIKARGIRSGLVVAQSARPGLALAIGSAIHLKIAGGRL